MDTSGNGDIWFSFLFPFFPFFPLFPPGGGGRDKEAADKHHFSTIKDI